MKLIFSRKLWMTSLTILTLSLLSACGPLSVQVVTLTAEPVTPTTEPVTLPAVTSTPETPAPSQTPTAVQPTTVQATSHATNTPLPPATDTALPPSATTKPTQAKAPTLTPVNPETFPYLDDRSTATGLITSLFNAINHREYVRAYSYWATNGGSGGVAPFDQFKQGYAGTQMIQVELGPVGHDEGAGQLYYSIGALLKATQTDGTSQTYTACYNMHLSNPAMQSVPPFVPLWIEDGKASLAASNRSDATLLAHACDGIGRATQPVSPSPVTNTKDITSANYLDDRTGPVEVLSSMFNAINRHEYGRAYSYWENAGTSSSVPPFDQFQKGYENTASVMLTTGTPVRGLAAGQIYYSLPAVIVAQTTSGATQTFSGCYRFHLAQPDLQAVPPFMPLAIQSATVNSVANNADQAALLKQACAGQ
jgi:hypothetical protein